MQKPFLCSGSVADLSQRFQILLTEEQYRFIKEKAAKSGQSASDLIRLAVDTAYRPRSEPPPWKEAAAFFRTADFGFTADPMNAFDLIYGPKSKPGP